MTRLNAPRDVPPPPPGLLPLVAPGDELTLTETSQYSRHLLIPEIGQLGQRRLKNSKVLVMGAGGLGSPVLLYLAAAGVGQLGIVDFDVVDNTNLQRQIIHGHADVGRAKTTSAAESIAEINPLVETHIHEVEVTKDNVLDLFGSYDLVIDGTDNFATRYLVNDACAILGKPYIWGSILQFEGQISVFWASHGPNYRDLYPVPPPAGTVPSCAEGGVFGVLCATIGSVMATEAIKLICGIGETLLGKLLIYDALTMSFRTVPLARDPQRRPITELIDYDNFCGVLTVSDRAAADEYSITGEQLDREMQSPIDVLLLDVRSSAERDIVTIEGDSHVPLAQLLDGHMLPAGPSDRRIVLYCRSGERSARAVLALHEAGYENVAHLAGGVQAWARDIQPWLPTY